MKKVHLNKKLLGKWMEGKPNPKFEHLPIKRLRALLKGFYSFAFHWELHPNLR